jgi:hypothetical protein
LRVEKSAYVFVVDDCGRDVVCWVGLGKRKDRKLAMAFDIHAGEEYAGLSIVCLPCSRSSNLCVLA